MRDEEREGGKEGVEGGKEDRETERSEIAHVRGKRKEGRGGGQTKGRGWKREWWKRQKRRMEE